MRQTLPGYEDSPAGELDRHFQLPAIRRLPPSRPFVWLSLGWRDMRNNLTASLVYGLAFAAAGFVILSLTTGRPHLFTVSISGFFLVAPLLAAGLYEISRGQGSGTSTGLWKSLDGWRRNGESIAYFGLFLALATIGWERLSAILFALFYGGAAPDLQAFYRDVFLSGTYWQLVIAYLAIGGMLAAMVFALSAISIPMLVDRNVDTVTAMATSFVAVSRNIATMAVWAVLIVGLTAIGFATLLVGLIVIFPLLGHATWHAYKELTQ